MRGNGRLVTGPPGWRVPAASGAAALSFAVLATALAWRTDRESAWLAAPVQACGLAGIAIGTIAWAGEGEGQRRLGRLAVLAGAAYYLQDLRASASPAVFGAGFCLAYLWTAVCAHVILSSPGGRLASAGARLITAACYLLAVGSQAARYAADRPVPPWGYGINEPATAWTRAGSLLFAAMAVTVLAWTAATWQLAAPGRRRSAWPVWGTLCLVAALSTAAAAASAAGAPQGVQDGMVAVAVGAGVLLVPATWIYAAMQQHVADARAANERAAQAELDTRQQIQRDVHDHVQGQLYAAAMNLEMLAALTAADPQLAASAARAQEGVTQAWESVLRLTRRVYPATLDHFGIAAALDSLADQFRARITITVSTPGPGRRWAAGLERNAYFLVSEALTNSVKHAHCDRVDVAINESRHYLSIDVRDNGRTPVPPGVVPRSLSRRVTAMGGRLTISTHPPPGTRILITVPKEEA